MVIYYEIRKIFYVESEGLGQEFLKGKIYNIKYIQIWGIFIIL